MMKGVATVPVQDHCVVATWSGFGGWLDFRVVQGLRLFRQKRPKVVLGLGDDLLRAVWRGSSMQPRFQASEGIILTWVLHQRARDAIVHL